MSRSVSPGATLRIFGQRLGLRHLELCRFAQQLCGLVQQVVRLAHGLAMPVLRASEEEPLVGASGVVDAALSLAPGCVRAGPRVLALPRSAHIID